MARHLNLEEQEQLDRLKEFWAEYGRTILVAVILVIAIVSGRFGWDAWQDRKANGASLLYDDVIAAIEHGSAPQAKEFLQKLQTEYGSTAYASLSSLNAAVYFYAQGNLDDAQEMLEWVQGNSKDAGWVGLATLRLADVLTDQKKYDEALQGLAHKVPESFIGLVEEKKGNVYVAQGENEKAIEAFLKAYQLSTPGEYREYIGAKLSLLGRDVTAEQPTAGAPQA